MSAIRPRKRRPMSFSTSGSRSSVSGSTVVIGQRRAQRVEPDHGVADVQLRPCPPALGEALDPADHDVRPEPPDVAAELGHGAVGRDEEREDVEAGEPVERGELGVVARGRPHEGERLG